MLFRSVDCVSHPAVTPKSLDMILTKFVCALSFVLETVKLDEDFAEEDWMSLFKLFPSRNKYRNLGFP